jgi:hypothetical protein
MTLVKLIEQSQATLIVTTMYNTEDCYSDTTITGKGRQEDARSTNLASRG